MWYCAHVVQWTKKKTEQNRKYEKKPKKNNRRKKKKNVRIRGAATKNYAISFCHECKYLKYILVLSLLSVALISDANICSPNSKLKANICFVCGLLSHFTKHTYTHIHIQAIRNQKEPQCKYHKLRILSEEHEREKAIEQENKKNHTLDNREQNRPNKCKKTNFKVESNWRTSWNSKIPSLIVNASSTFFSNNFSSVVVVVVVFHSVLLALPFWIWVVTSLKSIHANIFRYILVHGGNKHDLCVCEELRRLHSRIGKLLTIREHFKGIERTKASHYFKKIWKECFVRCETFFVEWLNKFDIKEAFAWITSPFQVDVTWCLASTSDFKW